MGFVLVGPGHAYDGATIVEACPVVMQELRIGYLTKLSGKPCVSVEQNVYLVHQQSPQLTSDTLFPSGITRGSSYGIIMLLPISVKRRTA